MANGILFSQMIPRDEDVDRFNDWYESDHVPARMVLPHFVGATRYAPADAETPDYLAVYEVDDLVAFDTDGYLALKRSPSDETAVMLSRISGFTRYISEEISDSGVPDSGVATKFLSVVAFAVPEEDEQQFDDWYGNEHVPMLLEAGDWLRVRRYRVRDGVGGPWTHLALHELSSIEVMDSPERGKARKGPKRNALVTKPWFENSGRWMYRKLSEHRAGGALSTVADKGDRG